MTTMAKAKGKPGAAKGAASGKGAPGKDTPPAEPGAVKRVLLVVARPLAPVLDPVRRFIASYDQWVSLVMRLLLAAMWFFYSLPKLSSPEQNVQSVRNFKILPESMVTTWGYAQPWLEMALGLLLIIGLGTRLVAIFSALLLLTYIGGIVSLGARGIYISCGCGGAGGQVAKGHTRYTLDVLRDLLYMVPALWLIWKPASKFSAERALLGDPIQ